MTSPAFSMTTVSPMRIHQRQFDHGEPAGEFDGPEVRDRGEHARATYLDVDGLDDRRRLLGVVFEGEETTGELAGGAETLAEVELVDLDDDAIHFVWEILLRGRVW